MRGVGQWRRGRSFAAIVLGALASGCSLSEGPPRLYTVAEETAAIRANMPQVDPVRFSQMDEATRVKYRNDWIAGRMYAIDIQYTAYEADLTRERQAIGFGAATAVLGLTTASNLLTPVATKNVLTGAAGVVTGTRAAYDSDVLMAHSIQWIQNQMRTQRSIVGDRIFRGMRTSTTDYPLAAALSDLEDYYRAGTFTGGLISTSAALGNQAELAELLKQDKIQFAWVSTATGNALKDCLNRPPSGVSVATQRERLLNLMNPRSSSGFALMMGGKAPGAAQDLLQAARIKGICL